MPYPELDMDPFLGNIASTQSKMRPIVTGVPWSVCQTVGHNREPYKNGRTNRHAVWDADSGGVRIPRGNGQFGDRFWRCGLLSKFFDPFLEKSNPTEPTIFGPNLTRPTDGPKPRPTPAVRTNDDDDRTSV